MQAHRNRGKSTHDKPERNSVILCWVWDLSGSSVIFGDSKSIVIYTSRIRVNTKTIISGRDPPSKYYHLHLYHHVGEPFNDWGGGRGCHNLVPVLEGDGMKIASPGDVFDQPPGEIN